MIIDKEEAHLLLKMLQYPNERELIEDYYRIRDALMTLIKNKPPKYQVGQTVWFMFEDSHVCSLEIDRIEWFDDGYFYYDITSNYNVHDSHPLFESKADLIKSRIEYWRELLSQEMKKEL